MSSSPRQPLQGRADWAAAGEANSQIVVQLLYFYSRSETSTGGGQHGAALFRAGVSLHSGNQGAMEYAVHFLACFIFANGHLLDRRFVHAARR
jgi:hypothetical protein